MTRTFDLQLHHSRKRKEKDKEFELHIANALQIFGACKKSEDIL
jgi:hypothetical protein